MERIGAWLVGPTTGVKALVALACVVLLVLSGCSNAPHSSSEKQAGSTSNSRSESKKTQGLGRDEALHAAASPEDAILSECRHDDKNTRLATSRGGTGAAESIKKAMNRG